MCLGAYGNQIPPEKLVEGLGGERGGVGGGPLFEVWFQLESARREKLELGGAEMERFEGERSNARFELSLELQDGEKEITGIMEYDADLFDPHTISLMLQHFKNLLDKMVAFPETSIAALSIAGEQESGELALAFSANLED
jgi:non-ribosomal peptide synthetase component F